MSALLARLVWWWRPFVVHEARPVLTSEADRRRRDQDAEHLQQLMQAVDAELELLRKPDDADVGD